MSERNARLFVAVGDNPARAVRDGRARPRRAGSRPTPGFECAETPQRGPRGGARQPWTYAWDPAWLKAIADAPGTVLTLGGKPVLAHVPADDDAAASRRGDGERASDRRAMSTLDAETAELNYAELRKRERPFVLPLDPADPEPVERAAYDAAYKGVTDVLTLYLWRKPAFYLTRWAAQAGPDAQFHHRGRRDLLPRSPSILFWVGEYWLGRR